jgi:hypothetical protein
LPIKETATGPPLLHVARGRPARHHRRTATTVCARIGWSYRASTRISATQHASVPIPHPVRLQLSLRQPSDERLDARISGAGEDPRRRVASYAWPLSSRRVPIASAAVPPTDASPVPPLSLARVGRGPVGSWRSSVGVWSVPGALH